MTICRELEGIVLQCVSWPFKMLTCHVCCGRLVACLQDRRPMTPAHAEAGLAAAGIIQEPMRLTWNAALEETEMVLFESVHKLFKATGVNAQDVSPSCHPLHLL